MYKIKAKNLIAIVSALFIFTLISIINDVNPLIYILIFSFVYITLRIAFSYRDIVFLFFLFSFFTFLLGREVIFEYFHVERYYLFNREINDQTYLLILLSLWTIYIIYALLNRRNVTLKQINSSDHKKNSIVANTCKIVFYVCYIPLIIYTYYLINRTQQYGYVQSYVSANFGQSTIITLMSIAGDIGLLAMFIYLASFPSNRATFSVLALYVFYSIFTVFTGRRAEFICNIFTVLVYLDIRSKKMHGVGWFTKKRIITFILCVPILLSGLYQYDSIRSNREQRDHSLISSAVSFFDQQGGSINVIKWSLLYKDELPEGKVYSFSSCDSNIKGNIVVRKLFNTKAYYGNSVEHALKGSSLADAISFLVFKNVYLRGRGVGSCYIAENYHDLGYLGVLLGSVFYGVLLYYYKKDESTNLIIRGITFLTLNAFFITPRMSFDYPVGVLFSYSTIIGVILILSISMLFNYSKYGQSRESEV